MNDNDADERLNLFLKSLPPNDPNRTEILETLVRQFRHAPHGAARNDLLLKFPLLEEELLSKYHSMDDSDEKDRLGKLLREIKRLPEKQG